VFFDEHERAIFGTRCLAAIYESKFEVFAFTATAPASRDFKYCDQIRSSSSSAPANIAQGFGRFRPREFARFLEIARASLVAKHPI
jgi:four helix bundle protein